RALAADGGTQPDPGGVKKLTRKTTGSPAARKTPEAFPNYEGLLREIAGVLHAGKRQAAWSLNTIMSAVYWDIGRRIVEFEQKGQRKASYGERLIDLLAVDMKQRFGRGFGRRNLFQIRAFYLAYQEIVQTVSGQLGEPTVNRKVQTLSAQSATSTAG